MPNQRKGRASVGVRCPTKHRFNRTCMHLGSLGSVDGLPELPQHQGDVARVAYIADEGGQPLATHQSCTDFGFSSRSMTTRSG